MPSSHRICTAIFILLALGGAAADLWSKSAVFAWRHLPGYRPPYWIVDNIFGIQTAVNIGAVFGLGAGKGLFFAAFSLVALSGILVWMFKFGGVASRYLTVTLGMICGGILGNLYDRLGLWTGPYQSDPAFDPRWSSGVRDWILFRIEGVPGLDPWPNFNIADSLLVVGAILLVVYSLLLAPAETAAGDPSDFGNPGNPEA